MTSSQDLDNPNQNTRQTRRDRCGFRASSHVLKPHYFRVSRGNNGDSCRGFSRPSIELTCGIIVDTDRIPHSFTAADPSLGIICRQHDNSCAPRYLLVIIRKFTTKTAEFWKTSMQQLHRLFSWFSKFDRLGMPWSDRGGHPHLAQVLILTFSWTR